MDFKNFFKGIIVGIGGVAPGLSGSVLLVIFGLYQKTINAIGTIFKDFKKNVCFLIPLFLGFGVGVLLFSKVVNFLLNNFEAPTRFAFLGLILGTLPLFWKEVKKEGFNKKYYIAIVAGLIVGILLFYFNANLFPVVTEPNLFQSVILGVAVAGSSIVPGVDSAAILSSLGLYELYVESVAELNFAILIPAGVGLGLGVLVISFIVNKLIKHCYTLTFSIIFGLFLSVIPKVLNGSCIEGFNIGSIFFVIFGFLFSLYFGDIQNNNEKIKNFFWKIKEKKSVKE